ncbi:hypothetical protein KKF34_07465 [Myxococcota bacterium]|nr:hypothetical protein [Myxococcota bacterium]MBU1382892.1 hypothetical protein [Myxococcota bacterium]MBU1496698.1 hypothetical protein [Myxococcota bacterium]
MSVINEKEVFFKNSFEGLKRQELPPEVISIITRFYDKYGNKPVHDFLKTMDLGPNVCLSWRRSWVTSGGFIIAGLYPIRETVKHFRIFNPFLEIGQFETEINTDLMLLEKLGYLKIENVSTRFDYLPKRVKCTPIDRKGGAK